MAMSSTKKAALLAEIQKNPEISTNNASYVGRLIDGAEQFIVLECRLPRYPELMQGTSTSAASPSTDLTGIDTNTVYVDVNYMGATEITLTLANCDSGANTAAEMQTQIRAADVDSFDEVTVSYASSLYVITSGRYGEDSAINVTFDEDYKHVAQAMKLGPTWGGTEVSGSAEDSPVDALLIRLVETKYVQMSVEGVASGGLLGGVSFSMHDIDPDVARLIRNRRRIPL